MIGHIFYILSLFLFIGNINILRKFYKLYEYKDWAERYKSVIGKSPKKADFENKNYSEYTTYTLVQGLNSLWLVFGIVSNSWMIFIGLVLITILVNSGSKYIESVQKIPQSIRFKINFTIKFIYGVILVSTMGFLILNHFHFHLDIMKILIK